MITTDRNKAVEYADKLIRYSFLYLAAAVFCALFGAVYETFSHEVYSFYMIYAFALPLVPGALLFLAGGLWVRRKAAESGKAEDAFRLPGNLSLNAWGSGIAALTVGCVFQGILEIYGTTNRLAVVYPVVGGILLAAGFVSFAFFLVTANRAQRREMAGEGPGGKRPDKIDTRSVGGRMACHE